MHSKRSTHISSLSIVLPHPPLPRRPSVRASTDSLADSAPKTPRNSSGASNPSAFKFDTAPPRKSTDSWNSSNHDGGDDEMEWEWTTEQLALLGKTLDAIPNNILTPYHGPVPPANVLDKIARSIINAKDPLEWPHSIRSTRMRLLKLARSRSEDDNQGRRANDIPLQDTNNVPKKKPLYRQSSMDFLKGNLKDGRSFDRLSARLQRVDRVFSNPAHAYCTSNSPSSPPPTSVTRPFSIGDDSYSPMTPTDTLHHHTSLSSLSACSSGRGPRLRRSTTNISNLPFVQSGISTIPENNVPLQIPRIKRSGSFSSPSMNGLGHSLKRAPSYGTLSSRSHGSSRMSVDDQKENSPQKQELDIYPSSDDEDKIRYKHAKKQKIIISKSSTMSSGTITEKVKKSSSSLTVPRVTSSSSIKTGSTTTPTSTVRTRKSSKAKHTPIITLFGAELPHPQPNPAPPATMPVPGNTGSVDGISDSTNNCKYRDSMTVSPETPLRSPRKTLRRVKTTNFPQQMSRRISFGSLLPPSVQEECDSVTGNGSNILGSAFQLS